MKKYRLRVGLDVDDILYDCNAYALQCLNEREGIEPPLTIYDISGWGTSGTRADERIAYFSDPDFVARQPMFSGAREFVMHLCEVADVAGIGHSAVFFLRCLCGHCACVPFVLLGLRDLGAVLSLTAMPMRRLVTVEGV